ncbi:hypothetical protein [Sandaracinus amylolyticus]|uniref:DUF1440 domain-containing protein n=1 Tax=Sandaracinus amylolyticus TaxID=927083 RepID=A0A0F6YH36_9BACT|nr:hypothetical protein [Sandaracinus amylolyticus]AKF04513.1 hypothetical protein DB32_001662 [Sandaracinus amylolyticus]
MERDPASVVSAILKGAIAGAIGVWVLDRVSTALYEREGEAEREREAHARPGGLDPTRNVVTRVAAARGMTLTGDALDRPALGVHYALGVVPGALYALARGGRGVSPLAGAALGLALFVVNDEVLNTAMRLAGPPRAYPWQAHARGLVAHLAYGIATDAALGLAQRLSAPCVEARVAPMPDVSEERPDLTPDMAIPPAPLAS